MKTIKKIEFILALMLVLPIIFIRFDDGKVLLSIIFWCLYLIAVTKLIKYTYTNLFIEYRKSARWCKKLSDEELEIVEDAKELIKRVDNNIIISSFNVYKVRFLTRTWFDYDEETHELNIFIPFQFLLKLGGKDFCFLAVLHEILHFQNLKNNLIIFNNKFLEGLNQLLTIWLIDNYSEKYKIPKSKRFSVKLIKDLYLDITINNLANMAYPKEVKMVKNILQKSNINIKQVFLNYIDIQPEFFKSFVPSKYFKNQ